MSEVMEPETGTALAVIRTALPTILAADENDILGKLAEKVKAHRPDISTAKGRDSIRSLAAEIASSKMTLIKLGKSLTEGWRKSTKAVNEECNTIEEKMDALKTQVRQPLTDFENAEKDRIAAHEAALACLAVDPSMQHATSEELSEAIRTRQEPEARNWQEFHQRAVDAHAVAIATLSRWHGEAQDRETEAAELARLRAEQAERERLAAIEAQRVREERIAAEAAEAARIAAEAKAAREAEEARKATQRAADAAAQRERDAALAVERAEAARIAAEERAEREKLEAAEAAERRQAAAVEAERQRIAAEKAAEDAETARRAANVAHRKRINGEALAGLLALGLTEDQGKAVITAIAKSEIPHVSIGY